jgi:hypothetical protein
MRGKTLSVVIALWLVGDGLQDNFPVSRLYANQLVTIADQMHFLGLKNIDVGCLPPDQDRSLLISHASSIFWRESEGLNAASAICSDNSLDQINFEPWLSEIDIVGNVSIKIFDGAPWSKFRGSCAARIEELRLKRIGDNFSIFVRLNEFVYKLVGYDSSELFAGVELGVVRDLVLLVDEPVAYGRSHDQEKRENSNGPGPSDHSPVKYGLGALVIAAALWTIWWGICHFIYTDNRKLVVAKAFGTIVLGLGLIYCGLWIVTS